MALFGTGKEMFAHGHGTNTSRATLCYLYISWWYVCWDWESLLAATVRMQTCSGRSASHDWSQWWCSCHRTGSSPNTRLAADPMAVKDSESIQSAFPTHKESFLRPNNLGMCISAESSKLQTKNQNSTYFILWLQDRWPTTNSSISPHFSSIMQEFLVVCPWCAPLLPRSHWFLPGCPRPSTGSTAAKPWRVDKQPQTAAVIHGHPTVIHGHPQRQAVLSSVKQCQAVPSHWSLCSRGPSYPTWIELHSTLCWDRLKMDEIGRSRVLTGCVRTAQIG